MIRTIVLMYSSLLLILGVYIFLLGFLPQKNVAINTSSFRDLPNNISGIRVLPENLYKRHLDKVVIMVIDALRYDFVINDYPFMPSLNSAIKSGKHCLLKVKAEAPTVTMPRIKSLMSGTVPAYSDIIMNLFSKESMAFDNLLLQAKLAGYSSVFYGDITWLDLFPDSFLRSEGTTSFVVTDYTEVDNNVTRNVANELGRSDWDLMILHYLGLDHIGHMDGPYSPLIKPKLLEMDEIIKQILNYIQTMSKEKEKVVLLVCTDHGMKDTGSHGGTSYPEIFIPYVFLNFHCDKSLREEEINQIDIAPLLAVILGLPIPAACIGKIHHKLLTNEINEEYILYSMSYNSKKLFHAYNLIEPNQDAEILLNEAEYEYSELLKNNFSSYNITILNKYLDVQKTMSDILVKKSVDYDVPLMFIGMLLMMQVFFIIYLHTNFVINFARVSLFLIALALDQILKSEQLLLYGSAMNPNALSAIVELLLWNILFLSPMKKNRIRKWMKKIKNCGLSYILQVKYPKNASLLFCMFIHMTCYVSTSFIEEEYTLWFYTTAIYLFFGGLSGKMWCFIAMFMHVAFRNVNRQGVMYSNIPRIADWFKEKQNAVWLLLIYILGLIHTASWCKKHMMKNYDLSMCWTQVNNLFLCVEVLILGVFKLSEGGINCPSLQILRYTIPFPVIWTCFSIQLLLCLINMKFKISNLYEESLISKRQFVSHFLDSAVLMSILLLILVLKPQNIFIISCILLCSDIFSDLREESPLRITALYLGLGMLCFFYQGNTNGLSTVDVSAGFTALHNPHMIISAFLITFNTFGSQILTTLLLFREVYTNERWACREYSFFEVLLCCSTLYMFDYSVVITLQRHHLFIWSVFSPKLLYVAFTVTLYTFIVIYTLLIGIFYSCVFRVSAIPIKQLP